MRLENDNISPHWSAFEWDWLLLIIPGDTGAHLDAQFPVAPQCINIPLSQPLPACLSLSLFLFLSTSLSLCLCLWAPLFEAPLIVALWSEKVPLFYSTILKGDEIGVYQTTEPLLLSVICAAQRHRLGAKSDINPLYVRRFGFQRKQLVSRANYLIWPLLAQELCKVDLHTHAS